ncbi:MAG TPA: OPT/YSL family transporter, partial [Polyangia bacterium]
CIGMFGIGVGMLYTPILVDRLQLEYPSGHAVANILRALTDPRLLRRSIGRLGGGTAAGLAVAALLEHLALFARFFGWLAGKVGLLRSFGQWVLSLGRFGVLRGTGEAVVAMGSTASASTFGAGLIVGSRIGVPAAVMAGIGYFLTPHLRAIGVLGAKDPFRKVGFLVGLAMIFSAGIVDLTFIAVEAVRRMRARSAAPAPAVQSGGLSTGRLAAWVAGWGLALVLVATLLLGQPLGYVLFAIALVFLFVFINGISQGISDWNPISSAFVVTVLLMSAIGLRDPIVAMMAASVLLASTIVGCDMQQDRSTGWRLGSKRAIQFRYQAAGIAMGSVLCVALARFFMSTKPVLNIDTFAHPDANVGIWQSAMTYKLVGAIRGIGHLAGYQLKALAIGVAIGIVIAVGRRMLAASPRYQRFIASGTLGFAIGWIVDAIVLASPYASSTGGFLELTVSLWFASGGVAGSLLSRKRADASTRPTPHEPESADGLPADMSTTSLVGGGLIAGESLYALGAGLASLFGSMLLGGR